MVCVCVCLRAFARNRNADTDRLGSVFDHKAMEVILKTKTLEYVAHSFIRLLSINSFNDSIELVTMIRLNFLNVMNGYDINCVYRIDVPVHSINSSNNMAM